MPRRVLVVGRYNIFFKIWRHHLIGRIFLLMSNNISLKYLFDQQNLNARKARWLAFLSEYDFKNKVVDAL